MILLSLLVVIIFIWLIFNHPFKQKELDVSYSDYLDRIKGEHKEGQ